MDENEIPLIFKGKEDIDAIAVDYEELTKLDPFKRSGEMLCSRSMPGNRNLRPGINNGKGFTGPSKQEAVHGNNERSSTSKCTQKITRWR